MVRSNGAIVSPKDENPAVSECRFGSTRKIAGKTLNIGWWRGKSTHNERSAITGTVIAKDSIDKGLYRGPA
jgi:hypothetical protein